MEAVKDVKQIEFTEDFLRGLISDAQAGVLAPALKGLREDILAQTDALIGGLKDLKANKGAAVNGDNAIDPAIDGTPKLFKSFGEQAQMIYQAGMQPHNVDARLKELMVKAPAGMSEGIGSDGGFLVQTDFATEIYRNAMETGILLSQTRRIPLSANSNSIELPAVDETSRANGSRWGGVSVSRLKEAGSASGTKPKFRMMRLTLKKMVGLAYATEEMLQDAAILNTMLPQAFGEEFGFVSDDEILNGDGGGQMLGILNSGATVSVAKEAGQAAATVVAENIFKMWSRCIARSRSNAQWLINQDVEPQLFGMSIAVGTGGVPVYLPAGGLSASPFGQLFGRPVRPVEQCKTIGATGDIYLADLSQYVVAEKGGVRGDVSMHFKFDTVEQAFRFIMRNDGQPLWQKPLTPHTGSSNTLSPFVKLDVRA